MKDRKWKKERRRVSGTWSRNFYTPNDVEKHTEIISVFQQKGRKYGDFESLNDVTSMRFKEGRRDDVLISGHLPVTTFVLPKL